LGTGAGTIIAALFALGAAAAWGSSTALSKLLIKDVGATAATSMRFVTTTLISFLAVLLMGKLSTFALVGQTELLRFFVIAWSTGMIGLWIYYKGLTTVRASVSTILELVFPLLAIVIDAVMYKTFLLPEQMLAAAVLLFAMYRVTAVARE
jgi:drug/metabolite transporter (DMT)-like permease